jgi:hypothetical protein
MDKLYKVNDGKFLLLSIIESPVFVMRAKQIFTNNTTDFLSGIDNGNNAAVEMSFTLPEFNALTEVMVEWMKSMNSSTEVMNQLIKNKKE